MKNKSNGAACSWEVLMAGTNREFLVSFDQAAAGVVSLLPEA